MTVDEMRELIADLPGDTTIKVRIAFPHLSGIADCMVVGHELHITLVEGFD